MTAEQYSVRDACNCVHFVLEIRNSDKIEWNEQLLGAYLRQEKIAVAEQVELYYVYSLMNDEKTVDYYEVFMPIEGSIEDCI